MKVIANKNPVVYSNANGKFLGKLKGFVNKQKADGSLFNKAKGLVNRVGGSNDSASSTSTENVSTAPSTPPKPKGMSKGLKIGLIVGGIAVVATIITVIVIKMKKSGKGK